MSDEKPRTQHIIPRDGRETEKTEINQVIWNEDGTEMWSEGFEPDGGVLLPIRNNTFDNPRISTEKSKSRPDISFHI
tara:strand:- start:310 stop:540 length:231 start_codon:yes stop_codon:yes gene_type:complete